LAEEYRKCSRRLSVRPKAPRTIREERLVLTRWKSHLGNTRIDQISPAQVSAYRSARLVDGLSPRTINLHLTVLRNVFAKAVEDGILLEIPRFRRFRNSEARAPARPRLSDAEFEKLCQAALDHAGRNGQLLFDLLRFLGYSGARKTEALRMLWRDVDLPGGLVTFRNPKGGVARSMELNPSIRRHLEEMATRRDPDSSYLFPSSAPSQ
jgi:integrase